eukprot:scpid73319/ scgid11180/ Putative nuclease HARBI1; Harbinger transposase-derived nuclease
MSGPVRSASGRRRRRLYELAIGYTSDIDILQTQPNYFFPRQSMEMTNNVLFDCLEPASASSFFVVLLFMMLNENISVERRLWTAHPENELGLAAGFWEKEVLGTWENTKQKSKRWWKAAWIANFRMEQRTFCFILQRYGHLFERQSTHLRRTIPSSKRLAIALYYLCHSETYNELAALFHVGVSTASCIVHDVVEALVGEVTRDSISFPQGNQLSKVMRGFEQLSNLPMCGGAVDGTFVRIVKPEIHGDTYWCYKQHSAIIVFACVDHQGCFTFVDVGTPGKLGDAAVYNKSELKTKVEQGIWLNRAVWRAGNKYIRPFLIGDSAFTLSPYLMKIHAGDNLTPQQSSFNFAQIRARRIVECAFGRLKGRFTVVSHSNSNDPTFMSKAVLLCCSLHNIIERRKRGYLPIVQDYAPHPLVPMQHSPAGQMRDALGTYLRNLN